MVNYYLNYGWRSATDIIKQTEDFRTYETKSTFIHFTCDTSCTIQIFSGMQNYESLNWQKYNNGQDYNNITSFQKELEDLVPVNTVYTKHFSNIAPYIFIRILNTAQSATGFFRLMISNSNDKEFITASVRDSNLKLNQLVSLTRPTTDINLDILDGNITGFANVVIKAKGNLSNTEALLMNSDTVQGFFDNNRTLSTIRINSDSANDIVTTGTGAQSVLVNGLDVNQKLIQFSGNMNGTNYMILNGAMTFVNSISVSSAGALGFNSGHIRVWNGAAVNANLLTSIELGEGQSFNPQYEVPSQHTLYLTKMSIFGNCVDEGYIKIVKYTYTDPAVSNMLYKVIDKFSVAPQMNHTRQINFTIQDGERIAIYRKSTAVPQGNNDITVALYGTLKLTNLDIQSNI
jgi:hypothetical protein